MRVSLVLIPLLLTGCLSSHHPAVKPVTAQKLGPAPLTVATPPPGYHIERIKELFDLWQGLKPKILKLAHDLDDEELEELNEWLRPQGTEIKRTCTDPSHDHRPKKEKAKTPRVKPTKEVEGAGRFF